MRPVTLEITGFGTFRDQTTVDFDDANYFALVGPTGAGKSTIIDAICFALYGSVPRYENENLVAPVISQGGLEARVRLDFTIGDAGYTAVRVVRRTGKGATTKEARLEHVGEVLAGTADEVSDEIKRLIGLSFSQFTRCVVLPQGEFARFLHDKPASRQDLLVRLLNLDVYDRMRHAASLRATEAKNKIAVVKQRLAEDLAFATEDALKTATARASRVEKLRTRVADAAPALKDLDLHLADAEKRSRDAVAALTTIDELETPSEVAELSEALKDAKTAAAVADKEATQARKAVEVATKARSALPSRDPLVTATDAHERKAALATAISEAQGSLGEATGERDVAVQELKQAEIDHADALEARRTIEIDHAAHGLTKNLKKGEPCPVCGQRVATIPRRAAPKALTAADKVVVQSEKLIVNARRDAEKTKEVFTRWASNIELREKEAAELDKVIAKHPELATITAQLQAIEKAEKALEVAHDHERAAYDSLDQIRKIADEVAEREREARADFTDARDRLVALGTPAVTGKDLAADWKALLAWAEKKRPELAKQKGEADAASKTATKARTALMDELEASCAECEIDLQGRDLVDAVAGAFARARNDVERISKALKDAEKARQDLAEQQRSHDLANALANHLSARGFEKWLVNEAIRRLVVGASEILGELSGDQYALTIDDAGNFLVIDHHNADEERSARTLSGGETFLASLSLALALADQLAELAAQGAARLDAIFLDEGFGTLDPETLDTVAATVENLAARGRMVGIVTHVRELADRVPVRFQVKKDPQGSTIERLSV